MNTKLSKQMDKQTTSSARGNGNDDAEISISSDDDDAQGYFSNTKLGQNQESIQIQKNQ